MASDGLGIAAFGSDRVVDGQLTVEAQAAVRRMGFRTFRFRQDKVKNLLGPTGGAEGFRQGPVESRRGCTRVTLHEASEFFRYNFYIHL